MFHSNVAFAYCGGSNEFLCGGGGPGSPCQSWARCGHSSTAAKLNLMFHSLRERCINQSFWFAWTVASHLIPCKNKPGQNMMSRQKQCNLRATNKNKQQAGPFNSDRCSHVKFIIKNMAPACPLLSFKGGKRQLLEKFNFAALKKEKWKFQPFNHQNNRKEMVQ